ncbi:hypothetical protein LOK49_LG10G02512 [Camellia lanceoleosa]|uniref:Uncharacterized protein n=1 Tax=Camellia lanceoleosa TaxID=1840588 RepID=A0ACC0G9A7_9ERIC|nr:hypothetical protein LOK49_LG10G02512 [Camellia lanceoleosa]
MALSASSAADLARKAAAELSMDFPTRSSTRPGTDFPTRSERLLSQTEGQWREVIDDEGKSDGEDLPVLARRVTVREVLKYSLTWVIIPSVTVQAWTQEIKQL